MKILKTKAEVRKEVCNARREGKTIGFVPTMGYLHKGHLSLMERAKKENDLVVVSIFVNPTQFGPNEDYATYPRDLERDAKLAESVGVDIIFVPEVDEMYPENFQSYVEVTELTQNLCGAKRPGHFRGVCTVVTKLFNIVQPDRAYFGQKDAQQAIIIKRMVKDLDFPIEIITCPIVREEDGLAMSSRNTYLNPEERKAALVLNRSLKKAKEMIEGGERDAALIQAAMIEMIEKEPLAKIDYVSIVSTTTLKPVQRLSGPILIALAVFIGKTRLIDNIMLEVE
ncbi:pantoate--beta-alanine ligase [Anoxybacter fermentans]|uniref:Pantothenate synthetase n=1 Tax=Anoxybacter fermentans TaxID=1323375 RepID=A0A3Q9HSW2_9FIRM|nr:pantoate--beta-alanine ligase [Anoxybacter fermentans]AZR74656.1 pantoate--beta-alanine ligase [Anoxybacter fermentans]